MNWKEKIDRDRNPKCINCQYWSMWENECVHPLSKKLFAYTPGEDDSCELFEHEDDDDTIERIN
jgi:hypothetical protein